MAAAHPSTVSSSEGFDFFALGYSLIGLAGPAYPVGLSSHAALFPSNRATVVALFSGAFAASSVVFLILTSAAAAGVSRQGLFLGYGAYAVLLGLGGLVAFPDKPYKAKNGQAPEVVLRYGGRKSKSTAAVVSPSTTPGHTPAASPTGSSTSLAAGRMPFGALKDLMQAPFAKQLFSWQALALLAVQAILNVKMNVLASTYNDQLVEKAGGDVDAALAYSSVYNVLLPFGGLAVLVVGRIQDRFGPGPTFALVVGHAMLYSATVLIPSLRASVLTSVVFVVARPMTFSAFWSSVSHFFGFRNYGKIGGGLNTAAGVINLAGQVVASRLAYDVFDSFLPLNLIMLGLTFLAVPFVVYYFVQQHREPGRSAAQLPATESTEFVYKVGSQPQQHVYATPA